MAQANIFYKGEEKKFAINIQATGFNIDDYQSGENDFDLEVTNGKESFTVQRAGEPDANGCWSNSDNSLIVFYEAETVTIPPAEEGGQSTTETVLHWFAIIDTSFFNAIGQLNVIATAHITDPKASGGVRNSIDIKALGTLKNK